MADKKRIIDYRRRRAERITERGQCRTDSVDAYRERRTERLLSRQDSGVGWVFGALKGEGIDTTGMDVAEAFETWNKLNEGKGRNGEQKQSANSPRRFVSPEEASSATEIGGYQRKNKFKNGYGSTRVKPYAREMDSGYTVRKHTDEYGNWDEEREALHSRIIDETFEGIKKPTGRPVAMFMGGGPAAGKSTVVKKLSNEIGIPPSDERVLIDPDFIKSGDKKRGLHGLPEYDAKKPSPVHEESSELATRMTEIALDNGYNVLVDGTGDGTVEKMLGKIRAAKKAGHEVKGVYTFVPTETALVRNRMRERSVPDHIVVDTHDRVARILPVIASEFDDVKLYSTSGEGLPKLVAHGGGGKGLKIDDEGLYKSFLANRDYVYNSKRVQKLYDEAMERERMKKQPPTKTNGK